MADTQETTADIIAEMRRRIAVKMSDAWYTQEEWRKLCDRLEAAHRREAAFHAMTCEANERLREHLQIALDADGREHGDCAKMRKALLAFVRAYEQEDEMSNIEDTAEAYELARSALAETKCNMN